MENISKIVLTLDGQIIGYILDVAFDELTLKKIGYYVVDEETEGELFLKLEDVVSISDVAVIVKDVLSFEFVQKRENSLIGKLVFEKKLVAAKSYGNAIDEYVLYNKQEGFLDSINFSKNKLFKILYFAKILYVDKKISRN